MCGIFGIAINDNTKIKGADLASLFKKLAVYSESRGKESSGLAVHNLKKGSIGILKDNVPSSELIKSPVFGSFMEKYIAQDGSMGKNLNYPVAMIGHSRLVTKGSEDDDHNNQPVIKGNVVGIHNGIIVNDEELWKANPDLNREFEVDTEIFFALINRSINSGLSVVSAFQNSIDQVYGTVSVALLFKNKKQLLLATNNGSLYILKYKNANIVIFASESYILKRIENHFHFEKIWGKFDIEHLESDHACLVNMESLESHFISLKEYKDSNNDANVSISDESVILPEKIDKPYKESNRKVKTLVNVDLFVHDGLEKLLEYNIDEIRKLKRCTKCLLPETFPSIKFDSNGVCNICQNYKSRNQIKPLQVLYEMIEPYKLSNGKPDCIVPFSGGRDSSYTLHFVKTKLGLNPIAFTYDWGMVTDLARRNIARVCGKLGVENIIVSANIRRKRENIRKNIVAWLKRPELGMIPLFMAGDKLFFYYTRELQKQTGVDLNIWGINKLENTDFKIGFGNVELKFDKKVIYSLNFLQRIQLLTFISKNILMNPSYLNSSVVDSLYSFYSRYLIPKTDYFHLFDFKKWNENEIISTLKSEYDWEFAKDTISTWRIGDGTAPFYNYIYYTVAGFTEADTFRSNQIREGSLNREEALKLIDAENIPRFESIRWYLDIVGLDFASTIKKINQIPKLYR